jgi:hypothetical protein
MARYYFETEGPASISFEAFLHEAERTGISDPGSAMMQVLRQRRFCGIHLDQIENSSSLNPCGRPANLLAFLRYICEEGQWGANLSIAIDW